MLNDKLVLARHPRDRNAVARAEIGLIDRLRAEPSTRIMVISESKALRAQQIDGSAPALAWLTNDEVTDAAIWLYLGTDADPATYSADSSATQAPVLAAIMTAQQAETLQPEALRWAGLRQLAAELGDADVAAFTEAVSLANWHDSHRFCPRCGTATEVVQAGWVRRCPSENTEIYPRTDAAVIVRITDADDRLLLGSNAVWEHNRYSLLAGFVEPGESIESAVVREVYEESGVRVENPRYLGSQPWPFPASLMLGFEASLAADQSPLDTRADGEEIIDLRWFTRAELRAAGSDLLLPGTVSIAGALIREWLDAEQGDAEQRDAEQRDAKQRDAERPNGESGGAA